MKKYIAFDIGGTKVKHGIILEDYTIFSQDTYPTKCHDLDFFLNDMLNTIYMYTKLHKISGIAISLPGYIDTQTGYSEKAGSITALNKQNLKELLEKEIHLRVEIENDGNCVALAEKLNGNAVDCTDFICMTVGTGIGGGIFINNQILPGTNFRGGEFGFMITRGEQSNRNIMHHNASTSSLINEYKQLKGIDVGEDISGEEVFLEAQKNPEVKLLIDYWLKCISYGIFNLAVTLNPQKILIGGGVSGREELISEIYAYLEEIEYWKEFKIPIQLCKHKNNAGMLGALYHFKRKEKLLSVR
ncbi:ROK family protein [Niallia nealsonii]|uniref:Transcriptional regulator n=1 Tax=Niallia nealsonii TaxID=115979 RepID=A0A2N0YXB0_9BACI|nr:ROK family protein [Niallia nealsonii]PKG21901.1 transcriptional regulator [Niallia nealsonii]